jgi:hypothetical protein
VQVHHQSPELAACLERSSVAVRGPYSIPASQACADFYAERIASMWGAMCTAARAVPDTWLHRHWQGSIRQLGQLYEAARDGR